jgi:hypothetical protein
VKLSNIDADLGAVDDGPTISGGGIGHPRQVMVVPGKPGVERPRVPVRDRVGVVQRGEPRKTIWNVKLLGVTRNVAVSTPFLSRTRGGGPRKVPSESIDVHLLQQKRRPADELLAHILFLEARRSAAGPVIQVSSVREGVIGRAALIPVIDILFRRG